MTAGSEVTHPSFRARLPLLLAGAVVLISCSDPLRPKGHASDEKAEGSLQCSIPDEFIHDGGVGRDGIPALTNPEMVAPGAEGTAYLNADSRVVGLTLGDTTIAVPHNILWWHEVANFDFRDRPISVTLCPLTGSTLAFDRRVVNGQQFIVSGLLFYNNLIMTTREIGRSLFPQMSRGARCGPRLGLDVPLEPQLVTTWSHWKELHPETSVISSATGYDRDYRLYPYGGYDAPDNSRTLFPVPELDDRRPPKERVLGLPFGGKGGPFNEEGGLAFPYGELEKLGSRGVVETTADGSDVVVFWSSEHRAAAAHRPLVAGSGREAGRELEFRVADGEIRDRETGSAWSVDGRAVGGELEGAELEPVAKAYEAFWFAWALFQPNTRVWTASG